MKVFHLLAALSGLALLLVQLHSEAANGRPVRLPDYPSTRLTDRIHIIHAPVQVPSSQNGGFRSNVTFVLTRQGVVVIDPGTSVHVGRMVLKQIRKLTSLPVVALFNTHIHGDHWLGNQAFIEAYPQLVIYAHRKMIQLASHDEGERWISLLNKMTGNAIAGTRPVPPNRAVRDGDVITIGGTTFRIHHTGPAHTDHDIMIEIPQERAILCGDLVRNGLVGDANRSFSGTIAAINHALETRATLFIPGNGRAGDRHVAEQYRDFLALLRGTVATHYEAGLSDFEIKPRVMTALNRYHDWVQFKQNIGRLVSLVYIEVEADAFR